MDPSGLDYFELSRTDITLSSPKLVDGVPAGTQPVANLRFVTRYNPQTGWLHIDAYGQNLSQVPLRMEFDATPELFSGYDYTGYPYENPHPEQWEAFPVMSHATGPVPDTYTTLDKQEELEYGYAQSSGQLWLGTPPQGGPPILGRIRVTVDINVHGVGPIPDGSRQVQVTDSFTTIPVTYGPHGPTRDQNSWPPLEWH